MQRLGRMEIQSRGSRRAEGCGDFACDDAALAHPSDDYSPGAAVQQLERAIESVGHRSGDAVCQRAKRFGFDSHHMLAMIVHDVEIASFTGALAIVEVMAFAAAPGAEPEFAGRAP